MSSILCVRSAGAETFQRFEGDVSATPYALFNAYAAEGGADPTLLEEGGNHFLRLASGGSAPSHASITFLPVESEATRIVVDFAFRITPVTGSADGLGFALLNARNRSFAAGAVAPPVEAEEPGFAGSIGVGFDVFRNCCRDTGDEPPGHHLSIHYGDQRYEFAAEHAAGLVVGGWVRTRIVVEFGAGGAWVSVMLAPPGQPGCTAIDRFKISGVAPYASRVWFGARNGAIVSSFDLDAVEVTPFEPAERGAFSAPRCGPMVPIHAAALADGRVLAWDRHDYTVEAGPWLVEPSTGSMTPAADPGFDAFCAGHTFLGDGRLFLAGGHWFDGVGVDRATAYDAAQNLWSELPPMNDGRWYPTTTALGDGSVLVISGNVGSGASLGVNELPQIWRPNARVWHDLTEAEKKLPLYPWAYSAPDGRVFVAGPQKVAQFLDVTGEGAWQEAIPSGRAYRDYGSSVTYAPGKILIAGGSVCSRDGNCMNGGEVLAPSATAESIDLNAENPRWLRVADMGKPRRQFTLLALADGKVLAVSGTASATFNDATDAVLEPEIWDPANPNAPWVPLERSLSARGYHHTALLLPDARVWVGGGGHPAPTQGTDQSSFEILSPPYLFAGPRPTILSAPSRIAYGEPFRVRVAAREEPVFNLARLGAVTHGFDQSAVFVPNLPAVAAGEEGAFDVTLPDNAHSAPPGPYMLFALDDGVPSEAAVVSVTHPEPSDDDGAGGQGGAGGMDGSGGASGMDAGGGPGGADADAGDTGSGARGGAGGSDGPANRPPLAWPATLALPTDETAFGALVALDIDGSVAGFSPSACDADNGCTAERDGARWTLETELGVLELAKDGEFSYRAKRAPGIDRFDYTVTDNEGADASATLNVTIFRDDVGEDGGCDCRSAPGRAPTAHAALAALAFAAAAIRRRRRPRS